MFIFFKNTLTTNWFQVTTESVGLIIICSAVAVVVVVKRPMCRELIYLLFTFFFRCWENSFRNWHFTELLPVVVAGNCGSMGFLCLHSIKSFVRLCCGRRSNEEQRKGPITHYTTTRECSRMRAYVGWSISRHRYSFLQMGWTSSFTGHRYLKNRGSMKRNTPLL